MVWIALLAFGLGQAAQSKTNFWSSVLNSQSIERHQNTEFNYALDLSKSNFYALDLDSTNLEPDLRAVDMGQSIILTVNVEATGPQLDIDRYINTIARLQRIQLKSAGASISNPKLIETKNQDGRTVKFYHHVTRHPKIVRDHVSAVWVDNNIVYQLAATSHLKPSDDLLTFVQDLLPNFTHLKQTFDHFSEHDHKPVADYQSTSFGYRMDLKEQWVPWPNFSHRIPAADFAAVSPMALGAGVLPVCWQETRPHRSALVGALLSGINLETDDFPPVEDFEAVPVSKAGARAITGHGKVQYQGQPTWFRLWLVDNEHCAYLVWTHSRISEQHLAQGARQVWNAFSLLETASVAKGQFDSSDDETVQAIAINAVGLSFFNDENYRRAQEYFIQASDLMVDNQTYLDNVLYAFARAEANDAALRWLEPRLDNFDPEEPSVLAWHAWFLSKNGKNDQAVNRYKKLFETDHQNDEDFTSYIELLSKEQDWTGLAQAFEDYQPQNPRTIALARIDSLIEAQEYQKAQTILKGLQGTAFDDELALKQIDIYDAQDQPSKIKDVAQQLIDQGHASALSYFWHGYANYNLESYSEARQSLELAQQYQPENETIALYLDAIKRAIGEGHNEEIENLVEPVGLPPELESQFAEPQLAIRKDEYDSFYLFRATGYELDPEQGRRQSEYWQIRINDEQGAERFSTLQFGFEPQSERFYVNQLLVRDGSSGEILARADRDSFYVTDQSEDAEADFERTANLPVAGLKPGTILELVVTTESNYTQLPTDHHYLSSRRPIVHSAVFARGALDTLRYASFGMLEPDRSADTLTFYLSEPMVFHSESLIADYHDVFPWVKIGNIDQSWTDIGEQYLAKIEDKITADGIEAILDDLPDGLSQTKKIEHLSRFVQRELRYEAIEFGRRAQIPNTPQLTVENRYGDCKDHATLLHTLLREAGITSHLALASLDYPISTELPDLAQFDHMIVYVPEQKLFIDTTDKTSHLGAGPPRGLAGEQALVLSDQPKLIDIPQDQPISTLNVERTIDFTDDGELRVFEQATLNGSYGADLRGSLVDIEPISRQRSIQAWLKDEFPGSELIDQTVKNLNQPNQPLQIELSYLVPRDLTRFTIPAFFERNYLRSEAHRDRRHPFTQGDRLQIQSTTRVKSTGFEFDASDFAELVQTDFGAFSRLTTTSSEPGLTMSYVFESADGVFPAEQYRKYYRFSNDAIRAAEPMVRQTLNQR